MDAWTVLGVFLLGSGIGALLTASFYAPQVRILRRLVNEICTDNFRTPPEQERVACPEASQGRVLQR